MWCVSLFPWANFSICHRCRLPSHSIPLLVQVFLPHQLLSIHYTVVPCQQAVGSNQDHMCHPLRLFLASMARVPLLLDLLATHLIPVRPCLGIPSHNALLWLCFPPPHPTSPHPTPPHLTPPHLTPPHLTPPHPTPPHPSVSGLSNASAATRVVGGESGNKPPSEQCTQEELAVYCSDRFLLGHIPEHAPPPSVC